MGKGRILMRYEQEANKGGFISQYCALPPTVVEISCKTWCFGAWKHNVHPVGQHLWWYFFFKTLGMGSGFILANKNHELRSQGWSCYTSSCGLTHMWSVMVWFRCLLSPCFKSYVWLQQDKVTEKSLQELKILPEPLENLKAQRFPSDTQEKIGLQAQCKCSPMDLSSCWYSGGCFELGVLSQSLPVRAKCELSPTSRLAREEAPSHAAVLFSKCSHSLTPHTSLCQRMRQG